MAETMTDQQKQVMQAQEDQAKLEQTWPLWDVVLESEDDRLWVARPGVNLAKSTRRVSLKIDGEVVFDEEVQEGDPAPWVAPAKGTVTLRAKNSDMAKARALGANPDYDRVVSAKERKDQ